MDRFAIFKECLKEAKTLVIDKPTCVLICVVNILINIRISMEIQRWIFQFFMTIPPYLSIIMLIAPHLACILNRNMRYAYFMTYPTNLLIFRPYDVKYQKWLRLKLHIMYIVHYIDMKLFRKKLDKPYRFLEEVCERIATDRSEDDFLFFIYHPLIDVHKNNYDFIQKLAHHIGLKCKIGVIRKYMRYFKQRHSEDSYVDFCKRLIQTFARNEYTTQKIKMVLKKSSLRRISHLNYFHSSTFIEMEPRVLRFFLSREPLDEWCIDLYPALLVSNKFELCNLVMLYGITPRICRGFEYAKKYRKPVELHRRLFILYCLQQKDIWLYHLV